MTPAAGAAEPGTAVSSEALRALNEHRRAPGFAPHTRLATDCLADSTPNRRPSIGAAEGWPSPAADQRSPRAADRPDTVRGRSAAPPDPVRCLNRESYTPISTSRPRSFEVHNSPLSEYACGFRIRLAVSAPRRWSCGRRNSAISPTGRRSSSTSSSLPDWQVAADLGSPPASARLRGPGAGTFECPARAIPVAGRRGQHSGRLSDHLRPVFPPPSPPGTPSRTPSAGGHDPQVAPPPAGGSLVARRSLGRALGIGP
jgi:hypothetical protein